MTVPKMEAVVKTNKERLVLVTPEYLMKNCGLTYRQAVRRLYSFNQGKMVASALLRIKTRTTVEKPRKQTTKKKYGGRLTVDEYLELVPSLEITGARRRLKLWEEGKMDCDMLFAPAYSDRCSFMCGSMAPRKRPEDIVISEFERELGAEIEKNWKGRIAAEFL